MEDAIPVGSIIPPDKVVILSNVVLKGANPIVDHFEKVRSEPDNTENTSFLSAENVSRKSDAATASEQRSLKELQVNCLLAPPANENNKDALHKHLTYPDPIKKTKTNKSPQRKAT